MKCLRCYRPLKHTAFKADHGCVGPVCARIMGIYKPHARIAVPAVQDTQMPLFMESGESLRVTKELP